MSTAAIRKALHECVDLLLDAAEADPEPEVDTEYSSLRLPPDCQSRKRFQELLRSGAIQSGEKRGRHWFISREAWKAQRGRKPSIREATPRPEVSAIAAGVVRNLRAMDPRR